VAASNTGEFADAIRFGALALEGAEQADDKALQGQCCA
jgi:hypothetical protein